jgi:4-hydroxy-tetrahydrodipicolinate synthase
VIAGAGSNSTAHAIELTRDAEAAGADAILSVVPYYNKPIQRGLYAHFHAIAQSTGLPIILYDVPSRTACGLADETVARLAEMPQFIGLKDATGDVTRPPRLRLLVGPDFRLLTGDDATVLAFLAQGGNGCISVTSNIAPGLCRSMFLACRQGQIATAQRWAVPIAKMTAALFRETSPAPLKYALSLLGLMSPKVRLPLVELTSQSKAEVAAVMAHICDHYAEHLIGKMCEPEHVGRRAVAG